MDKTVVVTGGSGYIAGFVIAEFLNHGYNVRTSLRTVPKLDAVKEGLSGWVPDEALSRLTGFEADLTSPDGWVQGLTGADGVIHVASPLGDGTESAQELTRVAKGGTLNVLRAAQNTGVKRVVMTSSSAACTPRTSVGTVVVDEECWTDPDNPEINPYRVSKTESERAAWAFAGDNDMQLTTVLPGSVFGPVMRKDKISGNRILLNLLNGVFTSAIKIPLEVTDVRDLALLHRLGFENDAAIGQRFLATGPALSMPEVAGLLREHFPDSKTPASVLPNWMARGFAVFIPSLRQLTSMIGREYAHTERKAQSLLGWTQRDPQETVLDAAQSLADHGLVAVRDKPAS